MAKSSTKSSKFGITLYVDEQGDRLAYFQAMPNIFAFGDTPQAALEELKIAWEFVKEHHQARGQSLPIPSNLMSLS